MYVRTFFTQATGKTLTRKGKRLFHPLRLALTGDMSGPDIGGQLALLEAGEFTLDSRNRVVEVNSSCIIERHNTKNVRNWGPIFPQQTLRGRHIIEQVVFIEVFP